MEQSIVILLKVYLNQSGIEEIKIVSSSLLNFLKNPNKGSDFDKDLDTTLKFELKALIQRFAKGSGFGNYRIIPEFWESGSRNTK